jgi:DNA-binding winged helix-turn-helix (wHTH) protein/TolB-like protein/tetratricopeptide (TPR) repeat protein
MEFKESQPAGRAPFRIGDFWIEPDRNRVAGPSGETTLEPKIMDVLCALAERPGDVVSRAHLIDQLWGVEFGGDESLTRAISRLRKVFGDTRGEPKIIETISKRGYRLIAPVGAAKVSAPPSQRRRLWVIAGALLALTLVAIPVIWLTRSAPAPQSAERTGIVLIVHPFVSDEHAPSAEGLAEELSVEIARSPLIRAKMESGADAAPAANAMHYTLRGDVRRSGSRVRVNTQLVEGSSGEVVWGESYERDYDAQFSARDSIVGAISAEVEMPLLRAVKRRLEQRDVRSLAPWELILLVTWVPGAEGRPPGPPVEDSYWLQRRALELDPNYAPAHALFAELAAYHALFHPPYNTPEALERARGHAERALQLAPYDSEVLYQIALYYRFIGDRDRASATLQRVLELQPHHPLARIELAFVQGQCDADADAALVELDHLQSEMSAANPARWVAIAHQSEIYLGRGEVLRAEEAAIRSRQIIPMTWTGLTLAAANAEQGKNAEAVAALAEHRREWPAMDLHYFADEIVPRWCLGGPDTPRARAAFRRLADAVAPR